MSDIGAPRLDETDKEEMRQVARIMRPEWTEEDFERVWVEFVALKQRKQLN